MSIRSSSGSEEQPKSGSSAFFWLNSLGVALEIRSKSVAKKEAVDLERIRRQVFFDRLLARFLSLPDAPW
jgi:hypothetical protein